MFIESKKEPNLLLYLLEKTKKAIKAFNDFKEKVVDPLGVVDLSEKSLIHFAEILKQIKRGKEVDLSNEKIVALKKVCRIYREKAFLLLFNSQTKKMFLFNQDRVGKLFEVKKNIWTPETKAMIDSAVENLPIYKKIFDTFSNFLFPMDGDLKNLVLFFLEKNFKEKTMFTNLELIEICYNFKRNLRSLYNTLIFLRYGFGLKKLSLSSVEKYQFIDLRELSFLFGIEQVAR